MEKGCESSGRYITLPSVKEKAKPPPEPADPKTWPSFLAWFGEASLTACLKVAGLLVLLIWFAHRVGLF